MKDIIYVVLHSPSNKECARFLATTEQQGSR